MLKTIDDLRENRATQQDYNLITSLKPRLLQVINSKPRLRIEVDIGGDGSHREVGIHASEVGFCARRQAYQLIGQPKEAPVEPPRETEQLTFGLGHFTHAMFQAYLGELAKADGAQFIPEDKVHPTRQAVAAKHDLTSSCDGTWWHPLYNIVVEIKTVSSDIYKDIKEPKPEHVDQAHVYMVAFDIPLCWFIYVNKENGAFTECTTPWLIAFNDAHWEKLEIRIAEIRMLAGHGLLPPPEESWFMCGSCVYGRACNPPGLQKILAKQRRGLQTASMVSQYGVKK